MAGGPNPAAAAALAARNNPAAVLAAKKAAADKLRAQGPQGTGGPPTGAGGPQGAGKPKASGTPGWLAAWTKSHRTPGTTGPGNWDPTAGQPDVPPLTAFPAFDFSTLPDGSSVPVAPNQKPISRQAALLDPNSYASKAMQAFTPLIQAITGQKQGLQSGIGQANGMIDKSFGQAADSSLRGAQIVKDSNATANQGLTDLAARMAQAAGGDPTAAAAVGQASANQQSADTRFANIDAESQAAQAAAANQDAGTAKLAYKGVTDKAITDLATQLGQAQSQSQQAGQTALKDALGFNSDQETAQQSRDTAKQETRLAALLAGPQAEATRLANIQTRAGLKLSEHQGAVNDWTSQNAATRSHWMDSVAKWTDKNTANRMKDLISQGKSPGAEIALADPNAYHSALSDWLTQNTIKGAGPAANPSTLMATTVEGMKTQYPDSTPAARKVLAYRFVQSQVNAWNAYHPKNRYTAANGSFTPVK